VQRRIGSTAVTPPDYETENRALVALADLPETVLQTLVDTILDVLQSDSAGISLLTKDEKRFYWPAIAGVWNPHIGGGTPRDGPCGDVLNRNMPLMFIRLILADPRIVVSAESRHKSRFLSKRMHG
jgi:hypothetical protein